LLTPNRISEAERQWHAAQPKEPLPVVIHHPVDEELQTGDSRDLGGAMEIKASWKQD
jgi:hypothetical protein